VRASKTSSPRVKAKAARLPDLAAAYGQRMAVAEEGARIMVRGYEAMRKAQEQAGKRAFERHAAALKELGDAADPTQRLMLQAQLFNVDLEGASNYWKEVGAAAMEMQSEMLGCCSHLVESDSMLQATAAFDHFPWFAEQRAAGA
jgi:hypothetical protein